MRIIVRICTPESQVVLAVDFARPEDTAPLLQLWQETRGPALGNWGALPDNLEPHLEARALFAVRGERNLRAAVLVRWPGPEAWARADAEAGYIDALVSDHEEMGQRLLAWTEDLIAGAGHRYARAARAGGGYLQQVGYETSATGLPEKPLPPDSPGAQFGRLHQGSNRDREGGYGVAVRSDDTVLVVAAEERWYLPGGGIAGDDPYAGLKREVGEEAGYRVLLARPFSRARQGLLIGDHGVNKLCQFFVMAVDPLEEGGDLEHRPMWVPIREALDGLAEDASRWALSLVLARMVAA